MGLSNSERQKRLRDLVATVEEHKKLPAPTLIRAACKQWGITKRTADEYLAVLVDGHLLEYSTMGIELTVTIAGLKWLTRSDDDQIEIVSTPAPPSPPSTVEDAK